MRLVQPSTRPPVLVGSLRPDGAPSAGDAHGCEARTISGDQTDRPHGQCHLDLERLSLVVPDRASAARGRSSPRQRQTRRRDRSPTRERPKNVSCFCSLHDVRSSCRDLAIGQEGSQRTSIGECDLGSNVSCDRPSCWPRPLRGRLVGRGGVEPPTSRLSGVRSNHLSYRPCLSGRNRGLSAREGAGGACRAKARQPRLRRNQRSWWSLPGSNR